MRLSFLVLSALTSGASIPTVVAWGAAGHEIVATIAQMHLHPSALAPLCNVLNFTSVSTCHLAPIASWADRVRFRMRWSGPLHYVGGVTDHPPQTCAFPGDGGWAGERRHNVLSAVRNVTDIVEAWGDGDRKLDDANEATKFLVHFLGDMHMPLHLTGRERGGNNVKVKFGGRVTNLHGLWDNLLIAKAIRETPRNYTKPLPSRAIEGALRDTIYDPWVRRIMWEGVLGQWRDEVADWVSCPTSHEEPVQGMWQTVLSAFGLRARRTGDKDEMDDDVLCPYHWAAQIHPLNCEIIWPAALDKPPYGGNELASTSESSHEYHSCSGNEESTDSSPDAVNPSHPPPPPRVPYLQLDTPEYAGVIAERMIIEKLLAQAGIRLAATLNWLFADIEEEDVRLGRVV
ncbi:hypothetical protein H0H81_007325 [Sphagnurus paluster]|uniref:Phospholipase C/P1 nuclease n=1 Tax=Sphagnurus paluster TaxID=117069 RepID=A0A9P7GJJ2_9AGAR|nr:hypothetical protein H0H81_007325 [Sphagnurus paluster]